jgi:hypothetical protein
MQRIEATAHYEAKGTMFESLLFLKLNLRNVEVVNSCICDEKS